MKHYSTFLDLNSFYSKYRFQHQYVVIIILSLLKQKSKTSWIIQIPSKERKFKLKEFSL